MSLSANKMIKKTLLKKLYHSIFTKLLFISLLAWFLILITVVATFFISKHREGGPFYNNINLYINYILEDLGTPPDKAKALEISKKTGIQISHLSETSTWSTKDGFPDVTKINFRSVHNSKKAQLGRNDGNHILRLETQSGLLFFYFSEKNSGERDWVAHLFMILAISVILFICYLSLKRILQPLKWLDNGVHQVAQGNLQHQVPVRGGDELTELSAGFNEMTTRLKQLISTKERLLLDISHELRSPLTRIKVALEFISDEELKKVLAQDVSDMEHMIHAILRSAREHHQITEKDKERCNIGELVQAVTARYLNTTPGVRFIPYTSTIFSTVMQDNLRMVCSNLIENGLKFSDEKSSPVIVKLAVEENYFTITVTDFGCGISEEELPFIFETFYRVDRSRSKKTGGFGLGLSLCKAIVEAHGGTITARSTTQQGTEMKLTFPMDR